MTKRASFRPHSTYVSSVSSTGGALDAVEVLEHGVVVRDERPRDRAEAVGVDEVGHAKAGAVRLRLVRRADAARRRADVRAAERLLARPVEERVRRQDDVRAVGDEEVVADRDPRRTQGVDLGEERARVDDEAVPDHVHDARRGRCPDGMSRSAKCLSPNLTVWPALWPPW